MLVYAPGQNALYANLARRLLLACLEAGARAGLVNSKQLHELPAEEIKDSHLVLVSPLDLVRPLTDRAAFFEALSRARKRIVVLAEALETGEFSGQLRLPISVDVLLDVGFVPQKHKLAELGLSHVPYRFLFDGLLRREVGRLASEDPARNAERPIPWAFVGHMTGERVELARWLIEEIDAGGTLFLPKPSRLLRSGAISPRGMDLLLKKTQFYVWSSHHKFAHYESFRFREAILNGAVPLKLDHRFAPRFSSVPGVVSSRRELAALINKKGFKRAYEACRAYYLEHEPLARGLGEVLTNEL